MVIMFNRIKKKTTLVIDLYERHFSFSILSKYIWFKFGSGFVKDCGISIVNRLRDSLVLGHWYRVLYVIYLFCIDYTMAADDLVTQGLGYQQPWYWHITSVILADIKKLAEK